MMTCFPADGITIQPIGDAVRAVSFENDNTWNWNLRGEKVGNYTLTYQVSILVDVNKIPDPYPVETKTAKIEITANWLTWCRKFLRDHWEIILSPLLIPLSIWIYGLVTNRIKAEKERRRQLEEEKERTVKGFGP